MWTILFFIAIITVLIFSFVIAFGAPFLPTLKVRTPDIFELLALKPDQTILELGSGDGRILRAAAERGIYSIGYELNPVLVVWSWLRNWEYRKYIRVHWGNFWRKKLPVTDAIYVFLLNPYMSKLHNKLVQEMVGKVRVVSFAFEIPDKKPVKKLNGLFLYVYDNSSK